MKRTTLKRGKPLRRKTWLRSRGDTKYRRRPRDLAYMAWVRTQPCCAKPFGRCYGRVEADHAGTRGYGEKADDNTCIPLCGKHHTQRGSFSGPFRPWDQARMRGWLALMVAEHQDRHRIHLASKAATP